MKLMFVPERVKFYGMEKHRGRPSKEEPEAKAA